MAHLVVAARCTTLLLILTIMTSSPSFAAQFSAGVTAYQNGLYEEAEQLWLQVTSGEDAAQAAYNLAVMYEQGYGSQRSNARIIALYKTASERGMPEAQFNYGGLFYAGERLPRSVEDAIYWWSQAANLGHAEAQYNLAVLLYEGKEVDQSLRLASQWMSFSAERGYAPAISLLPEIEAQLKAHHTELRQKLSDQQWDSHEMWIFHQDPRDLTLELLRSNSVKEALEFIDKAEIIEVAHPYLDNGQVVVIAGAFTREQDALKAISELTPELQRMQPKPIAFIDVQSVLRNN